MYVNNIFNRQWLLVYKYFDSIFTILISLIRGVPSKGSVSVVQIFVVVFDDNHTTLSNYCK